MLKEIIDTEVNPNDKEYKEIEKNYFNKDIEKIIIETDGERIVKSIKHYINNSYYSIEFIIILKNATYVEEKVYFNSKLQKRHVITMEEYFDESIKNSRKLYKFNNY